MKKYLITLFFATIAMPISAISGDFGYYHTKYEDIISTIDHTNMIHVQAANPDTISLEDAAAAHPTAVIVFEFGILTYTFRRDNCNYGKCFHYDKVRSKQILDAVEIAVKKLKNRKVILMIADEPETNPPTRLALEYLIGDIKERPFLADKELWINYDNVDEYYTGHEFFITEGIDIASLTPRYGKMCVTDYCERSGLRIVMDTIAKYNKNNPKKIKWMVVGDGQALPAKITGLYDLQKEMAQSRGIEFSGCLAFAYRGPDIHGIAFANHEQRDAWRKLGLRIISNEDAAPTPQPEPQPVSPPKFPEPPEYPSFPSFPEYLPIDPIYVIPIGENFYEMY
jgi:hypothetical protein